MPHSIVWVQCYFQALQTIELTDLCVDIYLGVVESWPNLVSCGLGRSESPWVTPFDMTSSAKYIHGHHSSVLSSHKWRTANNSAGYLLRYIEPSSHILDIGCGPGTISTDFAVLTNGPEGHVHAIDYNADIIIESQSLAIEKAIPRSKLSFGVGDIMDLNEISDSTYDISHAHQVLQHIQNPIKALSEMYRVTKPGGIIAVRECDYSGMIWYPDDIPGLTKWHELYLQVARRIGGEPNAGRRLLSWALSTKLVTATSITNTATSWCYSTTEEREWWSTLWAERTLSSSFAKIAVDEGLATRQDLESIAQGWRQWGQMEDGWFSVVSGEMIVRVGDKLAVSQWTAYSVRIHLLCDTDTLKR